MVEIVTASFTLLSAVILAIYVSYTARQKGPILSNSYLWLSEDEKKKADTKAEYRTLTIVFGSLSMICFMLTLSIVTIWKWPMKIMWALLAFVLVYAVYDAIKSVVMK